MAWILADEIDTFLHQPSGIRGNGRACQLAGSVIIEGQVTGPKDVTSAMKELDRINFFLNNRNYGAKGENRSCVT